MNPSPPPVMHLPPYTPAPAVKRLHSVVCFAFRPSQDELKCYAIFVAATDVAEAKGDRMDKLLRVHPVEDGWESHSVEAVQVPDRIVQEAAMVLFQADEAARASPLTGANGPAPVGFSISPSTAPIWDTEPLTVAGASDRPLSVAFLDAHVPSAQSPQSLLLPPEVTDETGLTMPAARPLPAFHVEDLPRLTGPRIHVGSAREGKILPAEYLHGAALEAAKSEVSQALRDSIKVIGPAE